MHIPLYPKGVPESAEWLLLKEAAFIEGGAALELRKPEQLFSWRRKELIGALAGKCLGQYVYMCIYIFIYIYIQT